MVVCSEVSLPAVQCFLAFGMWDEGHLNRVNHPLPTIETLPSNQRVHPYLHTRGRGHRGSESTLICTQEGGVIGAVSPPSSVRKGKDRGSKTTLICTQEGGVIGAARPPSSVRKGKGS
jgi:hypothetical protein